MWYKAAVRMLLRVVPLVLCVYRISPALVSEASAEQLSVRRYSVAAGLAHSWVNAIHQDRKGYLWFGTREGLSRFDSYRFVNDTTRDGLPQMIVNTIAKDRFGRLWVGTNGGGVSRLIDDPAEKPVSRAGPSPTAGHSQKFATFAVGDSRLSNQVSAILFDASGDLWCRS